MLPSTRMCNERITSHNKKLGTHREVKKEEKEKLQRRTRKHRRKHKKKKKNHNKELGNIEGKKKKNHNDNNNSKTPFTNAHALVNLYK